MLERVHYQRMSWSGSSLSDCCLPLCDTPSTPSTFEMRVVRIGKELAVDCNKKTPVPSFNDIEGTRVKRIFLFRFTHPWCHPNCLSFSVEMPYAGDALIT